LEFSLNFHLLVLLFSEGVSHLRNHISKAPHLIEGKKDRNTKKLYLAGSMDQRIEQV